MENEQGNMENVVESKPAKRSFWVNLSTLSTRSKWLAIKVEIVCIVMIFLASLTLGHHWKTQAPGNINLDKKIPFKCVSCNKITQFTIKDLQKMQKPGEMGPMMGPMKLECPQCKKKELTQAVECPKCNQVFVMKMDPAKGLFDDKCPKCGESYAKAWQEKYRKTQGNE